MIKAIAFDMGGVLVDLYGRTSVPGLYAVGEVASSGVMGANRLASNSLVECTVFAKRIAEAVGQDSHPAIEVGPSHRLPFISNRLPEDYDTASRLGRLLARKAGIIRSGEELTSALSDIDALAREIATDQTLGAYMWEGRLELARLIVRAALAREESRGSHFRLDFPETLPPENTYHTITQKGQPVTHVLLP